MFMTGQWDLFLYILFIHPTLSVRFYPFLDIGMSLNLRAAGKTVQFCCPLSYIYNEINSTLL